MSLTTELASVAKRVEKLPEAVKAMQEKIEKLVAEMAALKKQGLIYASGHMRQKRYFMLVYPQKDGVRPSPTYIGTDPKRIQQALDSIERAKQYDKLQQELLNHYTTVRMAEASLTNLERVLSGRY